MTTNERITIWTRRRQDGQLAYPRCVRAHIEEIEAAMPACLSPADLAQIGLSPSTPQTHD